MAIRAPFNFVPVSDKVFFPDWADQINHDIPFSDGVSGTINIKIIAESPIFVRNGHTEKDSEDTKNSFSNIDGQYFIPGTSLKGAIRNVLEIMSFGKMQFVNNKRYSIRDLQLNDYKKVFQENEVHCGWMSKYNDKIIIEDHGIPFRVSHNEIDNYFNTRFSDIFKDRAFFKKESNKSPIYKYNALKKQSLDLTFELDKSPRPAVDKRKFVVIKNNGSLKGKLVFTGQPGLRKDAQRGTNKEIINKASGKFYEFIFPEGSLKTHELNFYDKDGKFVDFLFIHKDSIEWSYWKERIYSGDKVPVFLISKNNELSHFGLSYLYKLPFDKKIKEYLPDSHNDKKLDLAECIFGTTTNDKLKGRVSFSNALAVKAEKMDLMKVYMGSPKPTYYPIYLKQNGENGFLSEKSTGFTTMLNSNAQLRGWKRYILRDTHITEFEIPEGQDENTNSFVPLEAGSEFVCKVRFSNLKREELGALLLSIETNNNSYHSIGFAKSYGYGKIKVEINNLVPELQQENCIKLFNELMSKKIEYYSKQIQIKELNLLKRVNNLSTRLEYMPLEEFVENKKHNPKRQILGQYLQLTSEYLKPIEQKKIETQAQAIVTLVAGRVIQAKLTEGKDQNNKTLIIPLGAKRPRKGENINVKIIYKGGNIEKLELKK